MKIEKRKVGMLLWVECSARTPRVFERDEKPNNQENLEER